MNQRFASFRDMPKIPNNIIVKLAMDESDDAQELWKLLKYTSTDALSKVNLSFDEKMDIVWTPERVTSTRTQDTFNVFTKPLVPSSLNTSESQTQLKIYRYKNTALTQYESVLLYEFDLIVNESSCMVRTLDGILVEKTDYMEMLLINLLNGLDLGVGVNFLRFDRTMGGNCESLLNINNSKSLYGRSFLLMLRYIDNSLGGECNG